jgi:4-hydroxybenzoate polyprenyltransferase
MTGLGRNSAVFLEMIKVSHTLFALPFAIGAAFLAAKGMPSLTVLGKIVLAVLFARTAAMSFNRLVDHRLDARNPRTQGRALPRGRLSRNFVATITILALVAFVWTAAWINSLALALSPVAMLIFLGYSLTKRFTSFSHVVLGAALAIAPLGAWIAVTGRLEREPWFIGGAVLLWVSGFDIVYACMDADFDRRTGLRSIPARLGVPWALRLSAAIHLVMVGVLAALWYFASLGPIFLGAVILVCALLIYEHWIVRPDDLSRVNRAFFTMNGVISALLMVAMIAESLISDGGMR